MAVRRRFWFPDPRPSTLTRPPPPQPPATRSDGNCSISSPRDPSPVRRVPHPNLAFFGGWPTQVWVPHSIAHFAIEWGSEAACSSPSPVRSLPNFPRKRSSLPECVLHSHAPVRPPAVFHSLQLCVSEPSGVNAEIKLRRREGIWGIAGRSVTPLNRTKRD